jgi:epoxyqueuosine reductase
MPETSLSAWIVERAFALEFDLCGITPAQQFPELAHTEEWLARGYAGEMRYLSDPRRRDPRSAMPDIRSVIVCALNYNTEHPRSIRVANSASGAESADIRESPSGWISRYAWGTDYHEVLRGKLDALVNELRERCGDSFVARTYADTGPVQERILAKYAGLGWLGKNTLLLNQQLGSFFFLGVVLTTLELEPSLPAGTAPPPDLCGSCRRCIDACPTDALHEPYLMDARRCISYLTIELRGSIPGEFRKPMGRHVFGCDICQEVCPWNNRAPIAAVREFQPREFSPSAQSTGFSLDSHSRPANPRARPQSLFAPDLEWLASLSEEGFRQTFRGSAIKRAKWRGLIRNACIALGNSDLAPGAPAYPRVVAVLEGLSRSPETVIAESAQWALSRIQSNEPGYRGSLGKDKDG